MTPHNMFRALAIAGLILCSNQAQAAEWRIAKVFGQAWIESDGARNIALKRGFQISGKAKVSTGRNGKVVIVRGRESMVVGPNSKIEIPAGRSGSTSIRQNSGIVAYDVEKRNVRHFEVRTPKITAVVKGTQFTVRENWFTSSVTVTRGAVDVSSRSKGDSVQVRSGQKAIVNGKRGKLRLVGSAKNAPMIRQAASGVYDGGGDDDDDDDDDDDNGDDDDDNGDDDDDNGQ